MAVILTPHFRDDSLVLGELFDSDNNERVCYWTYANRVAEIWFGGEGPSLCRRVPISAQIDERSSIFKWELARLAVEQARSVYQKDYVLAPDDDIAMT